MVCVFWNFAMGGNIKGARVVALVNYLKNDIHLLSTFIYPNLSERSSIDNYVFSMSTTNG
jgi:hypothetical protein